MRKASVDKDKMYDFILPKQEGIKPCLGDGKHYIKGTKKNGVCFRCLMSVSYIKNA